MIGRETMNDNDKLPKREYHDGDTVEIDFEASSIDVHWHKIALVGVVAGVIYEKEGFSYKIQLRDNKRHIFGYVIVPEGQINGKIEYGTTVVECDFCKRDIIVNQNDSDNFDRKICRQQKYYCLGRRHHVLSMCSECAKSIKIEEEIKCPYDHCATLSEKERESLKKCGIKLKDDI